jgi:hypothetical protein
MAKKPQKAPLKYSQRGVVVSQPAPKWEQTYGMYLAGKEVLDEADYLGETMELKWGAGRLRLIVDGELRNKFDRQKYLYIQAKQIGDLEDVRREAKRMVSAWRALDRAAEAAGASPTAPEVWELAVPFGMFSGVVVAIVKDERDVSKVRADGRHTMVYSLEEIGRLIAADHFSLVVKETFPGSEVIPVKKPVDPSKASLFDGEDGIIDISAPLDGIKDFEELNDSVPF